MLFIIHSNQNCIKHINHDDRKLYSYLSNILNVIVQHFEYNDKKIDLFSKQMCICKMLTLSVEEIFIYIKNLFCPQKFHILCFISQCAIKILIYIREKTCFYNEIFKYCKCVIKYIQYYSTNIVKSVFVELKHFCQANE